MINVFIIYLGINLFLAGYYFADTYTWSSNRLKTILSCIGIALFGCILIVMYLLAILFLKVFSYPLRYFQVIFFIEYIFTKKWHNLPKYKLEKVTKYMESMVEKQGNTLRVRILLYCTKLINKRNNYKEIK